MVEWGLEPNAYHLARALGYRHSIYRASISDHKLELDEDSIPRVQRMAKLNLLAPDPGKAVPQCEFKGPVGRVKPFANTLSIEALINN
jgi:hypothetical protein